MLLTKRSLIPLKSYLLPVYQCHWKQPQHWVHQAVRVRFAPSPTGWLHLGGLRTALFNYLFAKQHNGSFILRIDDTDRGRFVQESQEHIIDMLKWAGIEYDEGPRKKGISNSYIQSERTQLYQKYGEQLVSEGKAYRCFCSSERLEACRENSKRYGQSTNYDRHCLYLTPTQVKNKLDNKEPYVIRLKIPLGNTVVEDEVHGRIEFKNSMMDDSILIKSDGFPTYHLATVVDDNDMNISHIIRGEEWLSSTPKHVILYQALDWKLPKFVHLPLLLNPDRSKLSKRHGDVHVQHYKDNGYLPEGLINFLSLLGFTPPTTQEIFTLPELIQAFSISRVGKSNAIVDRKKLDHINKIHLNKKLESEVGLCEISDIVLNEVIQQLQPRMLPEEIKEKVCSKYVKEVLNLMKTRISRHTQILSNCHYFWVDPVYSIEDPVLLENIGIGILMFCNTEKDAANIVENCLKCLKEQGMKNKEAMLNIRLVLTGQTIGSSLIQTAQLLGANVIKRRAQHLSLAESKHSLKASPL